jgi:hypothetical protein
MERSIDEDDVTVAQVEQVPPGQLAAARMINRNRAKFTVSALPVQQHGRRTSISQRLEMANAAACRRDHDALDSLLLEQAEVAGLAIMGTVGGAHHHGAALLVNRVLDAPYGTRRERVRGIEHNCPKAAAVTTPHLMSG